MTILIVDGVAKIYMREGTVIVSDQEGGKLEQTLPDLELLAIIGRRILATSAALLTIATNNIPVVFIDARGGTVAILFDPVQVGTINPRRAQYKCLEDSQCTLLISKKIISSKLYGLYNLVRYEAKYHKDLLEGMDLDYAKALMLSAASKINDVGDTNELRLVEAEGSRAAWSIITGLFPRQYNFTGRRPRGGDTINSAIDFTYAILYAISVKSIVAAGLDPYAGFMHTPKPGRTSLVYDFSELYKPLAIHAVLQASRIRKLKTIRGTTRLTPRSIEALVRQLYHRLHMLSEKTYKRKTIWMHPMKEAYNLRRALEKDLSYKPFTYKP